MVEEALKMAPKTITYGATNPKYDFIPDKKEIHKRRYQENEGSFNLPI